MYVRPLMWILFIALKPGESRIWVGDIPPTLWSPVESAALPVSLMIGLEATAPDISSSESHVSTLVLSYGSSSAKLCRSQQRAYQELQRTLTAAQKTFSTQRNRFSLARFQRCRVDKQRWQSSTGGKVEGIGATCSSASGKAEKRLTVPQTSLRLDRGRQCWQIPSFSLLRLRSRSPTLPLLTSPDLTEKTTPCN
ncbi:hypothetical protein F2Q70_00029305 [Brassica cretica]|uniref:Uncharacterized protein n=1 Tax=Brassica cretica TaxID=69181 RepID=A0A8S9FFB7_BRACR|nr:hypothetical protein F2Q70_00029305 [Brassica cretica]KAF3595036.1 hypothetical protein DY000_02020731 [Brassica cretica]